jgi:hypothetical protein
MSALKYWIHENSLGIESLVGFMTITMLKLGHQTIIHKRHEQQRHMTGRPAHPCSRPCHDQMINLHQVNDHVWTRPHMPSDSFVQILRRNSSFSSPKLKTTQAPFMWVYKDHHSSNSNHHIIGISTIAEVTICYRLLACFSLVSPNITPQTPPNALYSV